MTDTRDPFRRTERVDAPGIVGAEWWQSSAKEARDTAPRRSALRNLMFFGGVVTPVGAALMACKGDDEEVQWEQKEKKAIEIQKAHGWSFGAPTQPVTYVGARAGAVDNTKVTPQTLQAMPTDLAPTNPAHKPFFSATLFQSPVAVPAQSIQGDSPTQPISATLQPIHSPTMDAAYKQGAGLALMFRKDKAARDKQLVVVDLDGPNSVAFAAGLSSVFDPVFYFDNWPHPQGVVPAHQTLAAATYYQPHFKKNAAERPKDAPMAIILDRKRLSPYKDEKTQFDNRYMAMMPTAANLKGLNVNRVLYVTPTASDRLELDDLNADFVDYEKNKIDVKMIAASDFRQLPNADQSKQIPKDVQADLQQDEEWPPYTYGGEDYYGSDFWGDYGGDGTDSKFKSSNVSHGESYSPTNRSTMFSGTGTSKTSMGMGMAAVAVAAGTGAILGARYGSGSRAGGRFSSSGRSGSFSRGSSRGGG